MPRDRSNRIEVDLKLLQDKNVEKLQEFGRQFDKSLDKLAEQLRGFSERASAVGDAVASPGRLSSNASTGSGITPGGPQARMGGQSTSGIPAFMNVAGGNYGGGSASVAYPTQDPNGPDKPEKTFEQEFIEAQRRVGEHIPVGFRETLGYMAADQFRVPGISQERAEKWNQQLFKYQAVRANAMLGYGHVQNIFSRISEPALLGQQLGRSREGILGTSVGSSAFWTGIKENLKTLREASFGFDPSYSVGQARAARETLQQFGYSGDTSDILADHLKQLEIHQGVGPQAALAILDPLVRFGGDENLGQLLTVLQNIPNAAKAAHMNLNEFTQQLVSTAQSVAEGTGMTVGGAARALSAFTTTTGLAPSRAANLMSDPRTLLLASGMTGRSITSLMEGNNRMAPRMVYGLQMFKNFTGGRSAQELAHLRKTDTASYNKIMNGAWLAYQNDNSIFGGMDPRALINAGVRNGGRVIEHTAISEEMQSAGSVTQMESLLKRWGGKDGHHMLEDFESYTQNPNVTVKQARQHALDLISKSEGQAQGKAAKQMTMVGMTDETKEFFKLLKGDDTAHRSHKSWFARKAMPFAEEVGMGVLDHFIPGIG